MGSNGLKRPIFGQKCRFWAKFGRLWPIVAKTWFRSRNEFLLLGPKISDFGPKIRFLLLGPRFHRWTVCSPRKDGPFRTFGLIFRLFVLEYVKNQMSYPNSGVTCFCDTWQCFENERASELARYMQILPDGSSRPPGTSTHRHNSVSQPKLTSQHITMTMSTLQY